MKMAESPAHKFGQIIGNVLETAIEPLLRSFAQRNNLYLDKKGPRPARKGNKISWKDRYGNIHDLDFVIEKGGSPEHIGIPVAFIETAWRRYTKHSRNKAQEIQGAILPLAETHRNVAPFIGVILAGVFTDGALTQLKSLGFHVLYFPYETIVEAFRTANIDADFDENTPDAEFSRKVSQWNELSENQRSQISRTLVKRNSEEIQQFMNELNRAITRQIELIRIIPLHGTVFEWSSIEEAIKFIEKYNENDCKKPIIKYEVHIRFNNGDRIEGQFRNKKDVIEFLRGYHCSLRPANI